MKRDQLTQLINWKNKKRRKPLLLCGARQVGKTWLAKEFGRKSFKQTAYINFDEDRSIHSLFDDNLNPLRLVTALKAYTHIEISPDDTLIIFDEVQECPRALSSLKYFNEEAPEFKIIATGSQMGVAIHPGTSFPVGQVDIMTLYPLSFREFLDAIGEQELRAILETDDFGLMKSFSGKLIERLKQYYFIGGMPEAVETFIESNSFKNVREIQNNIVNLYEQDFSKHAYPQLVPRLNMVWKSISSQLSKENKKFVYGLIRKGGRAKDFELAIQWLEDCGLIHKVIRVKKPGIPLSFYTDISSFKIFLSDIGLLCAMSGINESAIIEENKLFTEFKGALTEQYVYQQLLTETNKSVYYYSGDNSRTEIDFLLDGNNAPLPIEVKAEENLQAKSLRVFCQKYNIPKGIRLSMSDYRDQDWMVNIPLYDTCSLFKY